jgi:hypothetical protein
MVQLRETPRERTLAKPRRFKVSLRELFIITTLVAINLTFAYYNPYLWLMVPVFLATIALFVVGDQLSLKRQRRSLLASIYDQCLFFLIIGVPINAVLTAEVYVNPESRQAMRSFHFDLSTYLDRLRQASCDFRVVGRLTIATAIVLWLAVRRWRRSRQNRP